MKTKAIGYIKAFSGRMKGVNLALKEQEEQIKAYAEVQGLELVKIYREKTLGGNITNIDELDQMYRDIREGNADTILIFKGDRMTRRWSINRLNTESSDETLSSQ